MLDDIERRVESLRATAARMEEEKESLLEMLQTLGDWGMVRFREIERCDVS